MIQIVLVAKRLLIATVALVAFTIASVIGGRIVVESLFKGIAIPLPAGGSWIARSAELRTRSWEFDRSVAVLHQLVSVHQGYLAKTYGRRAAQVLAAHCPLAFPCLRAVSMPPSPT
jgi:hypothetical protein